MASSSSSIKVVCGAELRKGSFNFAPDGLRNIINLVHEAGLEFVVEEPARVLEDEVKQFYANLKLSPDHSHMKTKISGIKIKITSDRLNKVLRMPVREDESLTQEDVQRALALLDYQGARASSVKKAKLNEEGRLLSDIIGKVFLCKSGSHDYISRQMFDLMTSILLRKGRNWGTDLYRAIADCTDKPRFGRILSLYLSTKYPEIFIMAKGAPIHPLRYICPEALGRGERTPPRERQRRKQNQEPREQERVEEDYTQQEYRQGQDAHRMDEGLGYHPEVDIQYGNFHYGDVHMEDAGPSHTETGHVPAQDYPGASLFRFDEMKDYIAGCFTAQEEKFNSRMNSMEEKLHTRIDDLEESLGARIDKVSEDVYLLHQEFLRTKESVKGDIDFLVKGSASLNSGQGILHNEAASLRDLQQTCYTQLDNRMQQRFDQSEARLVNEFQKGEKNIIDELFGGWPRPPHSTHSELARDEGLHYHESVPHYEPSEYVPEVEMQEQLRAMQELQNARRQEQLREQQELQNLHAGLGQAAVETESEAEERVNRQMRAAAAAEVQEAFAEKPAEIPVTQTTESGRFKLPYRRKGLNIDRKRKSHSEVWSPTSRRIILDTWSAYNRGEVKGEYSLDEMGKHHRSMAGVRLHEKEKRTDKPKPEVYIPKPFRYFKRKKAQAVCAKLKMEREKAGRIWAAELDAVAKEGVKNRHMKQSPS